MRIFTYRTNIKYSTITLDEKTYIVDRQPPVGDFIHFNTCLRHNRHKIYRVTEQVNF